MSSQISIEMPKYKCYKEVHALKINAVLASPSVYDPAEQVGGFIIPTDENYVPFAVSLDYLTKHKPQAGGYYVVYKDGYKSFSPASAFEEGYTRI